MARPWIVSSLLLLVLGAGADEKKPEQKAERCAVFVAPAKPGGEPTVKLVEKVKKAVKDKKKWFRLVDNPLDADLRIEVTRYGDASQLKIDMNRSESSMGQQNVRVSRPGLLEVEDAYFIELDLVVPKQFGVKLLVTGRGAGSAAKDVARRLRTYCETYCK